MDFKSFVRDRISYFAGHFERRALLLDFKGQQLNEIDLSFEHLSNEYLEKMEELQASELMAEKSTLKAQGIEQGLIKITDPDLAEFWEALSSGYKLSFNVEGQSLTDQTVLKLSQLYEEDRCAFSKIKLAGNSQITQVGVVKLGKVLRNCPCLQEISLHGLCVGVHGANRIVELISVNSLVSVDLGLIGNESLEYLSRVLENPHSLVNIGFGEDPNDPWKGGKGKFQSVIRRSQWSKNILSVNLYTEQPIRHYEFMSELCILCRKNRKLRMDERENEFKSASLNPQHNKYYDPDNHPLNAYKFSVKSYLTNVFGSLLDEALYFLEKERRNSLREEAIFQITQEPINKIILEDICTADGSIVVLTKYLLNKINQKNAQNT